MKLVNSRGRILLEVTGARWLGTPFASPLFYDYQGPGRCGCGPIESIQAEIAAVKVDSPSARLEGPLPAP